MKKAVFAILVAIFSLVGWSARAEVITYSCSEPDDPSGAMIISVDTKTHSATETDPGEAPTQGFAQVTDSNVLFSGTVPRVWSIQIDRNTGASMDSDGSSGTCVLESQTSAPAFSPAKDLNKQMVAEYGQLNITHDCQHAAEIKSKLQYFVSGFRRADKMAHGSDPQIRSNLLASEGDLESWTVCSAKPSIALLKDAMAKYRSANSLAPSATIQNDIALDNSLLLKFGAK